MKEPDFEKKYDYDIMCYYICVGGLGSVFLLALLAAFFLYC